MPIHNRITEVTTPHIDVQLACDDYLSSAEPNSLPTMEQLQHWADQALLHPLSGTARTEAEISVRIVDIEESQTLNREYRSKDKPTNVLSFPAEAPEGWPPELLQELPLGDLVISAHIVAQEASDQGKSLEAHWAHMMIHGSLHLLGYDHIDDDEAEQMEALEVRLLDQLGYPNPYQ